MSCHPLKTAPLSSEEDADSQTRHGCYYWLCAGVMLDVYDRTDPHVFARVRSALMCAQAQAQEGSCKRSADCRELSLGALGRMVRARATASGRNTL